MAKIVARVGLRKVLAFWAVFPAKNQAFEEKFGFCRAADMVVFRAAGGVKNLSRSVERRYPHFFGAGRLAGEFCRGEGGVHHAQVCSEVFSCGL